MRASRFDGDGTKRVFEGLHLDPERLLLVVVCGLSLVALTAQDDEAQESLAHRLVGGVEVLASDLLCLGSQGPELVHERARPFVRYDVFELLAGVLPQQGEYAGLGFAPEVFGAQGDRFREGRRPKPVPEQPRRQMRTGKEYRQDLTTGLLMRVGRTCRQLRPFHRRSRCATLLKQHRVDSECIARQAYGLATQYRVLYLVNQFPSSWHGSGATNGVRSSMFVGNPSDTVLENWYSACE